MTRYDWALRVKKRDGNVCVICGNPAAHAHHIRDCTNKIDNGVSLCKKCHILAHRGSFNTLCKGKLSPYDAAIKLAERAKSNATDSLIWYMVTSDECKTKETIAIINQPKPITPFNPDYPW